MSVQRKCPECGTWNKDEENCTECGTLISPILIEEERERKREKARFRPPTKFDKFIEGWKHSRFFVLKALYYVLYTIGFIVFGIMSFFAWLAATPNG